MGLNNTSYCESANEFDYAIFCVLTPVCECILAVFICSGNILTITAVCRTQSLQTIPNMYVVSLAVADLMVGFNSFYESFWYYALTEGRIAGCKYCCLFNLSTLYTSLFASMISIVLIAWDRFFFICYPFRYETLVTQSKTLIIIGTTWIVSLTFGVLPFFENTFDVARECSHTGVLPFWYQVYFLQIVFALVFILCVVLYTGIMKIARRQLKSIQAATVVPAAGSSADRKNWKVIRLMLLVCGCFFACWSPYNVCIVTDYASYVSPDVMDVLFPLGILNSVMNFVIYSLMNREFRKAFKRYCFFCRRSEHQIASSASAAPASVHLNQFASETVQ